MPRNPLRKSSQRVSASVRRIHGSPVPRCCPAAWPVQIVLSHPPAWAADRRWSCLLHGPPGYPGQCYPDRHGGRAEKVAFLYLSQFQRPHIKVILPRRMVTDYRLPGGFQYKVHAQSAYRQSGR